MAPQKIIDSHIHLWPHSAASSAGHAWMLPGGYLTRQFSVNDYRAATTSTANSESPEYDLQGFVYVETDRTVLKGGNDDVQSWAAEPLREIAFLRRVVEGTPEENEGFDASPSRLLKGIVAWAPLDRGIAGFQQYLSAAKEVAGEETWKRIRGCRYLLQGVRGMTEFEKLVNGKEFLDLLKLLGEEGWSFDVGVDQRSGGIWQLYEMADTIGRVHDGVDTKDKTVFILNHLCKPDMQQKPTADFMEQFEHWKQVMSRFAEHEKVYMKLSGSFSEMRNQNAISNGEVIPVSEIVDLVRPWIGHIFKCFGPNRILFGSDWPVCNVRGPGDEFSWSHWRKVVEMVLEDFKLTAEERDRIWFGTAVEAYRLDV